NDTLDKKTHSRKQYTTTASNVRKGHQEKVPIWNRYCTRSNIPARILSLYTASPTRQKGFCQKICAYRLISKCILHIYHQNNAVINKVMFCPQARDLIPSLRSSCLINANNDLTIDSTQWSHIGFFYYI